MTGSVAKATWPVPQKTVMKKVTTGARKVMRSGFLRSICSLTLTRRSRPPQAWRAATQEMTAMMIPRTSQGMSFVGSTVQPSNPRTMTPAPPA